MKVLIITYYWPPSGGAGVQRWVKFARYLPEFGIEPVILTIDPAYAAYPVTDDSLTAGLPESLKVYSTQARDYFSVYSNDRSKIPSAGFAINKDDSLKGKFYRFIRGNFFIPDPRIGWNRFAFNKACELIKTHEIKHVITTSPPHSSQLIGLRIKKTFPEINWIADLRDPWTDIYYYDSFYPTFISRRIDAAYEKRVLINADHIITVGHSLKQLFGSKVPGAGKKTTIISNGFDTEDFKGDATEPSKFVITYAGTLSDVYPIEAFLRAVAGTTKDIYLRFVGSVSGKQKETILREMPHDKVEFLPYADHSRAIQYMKESSALLLIIPEHISNRSIITGKLFEYLASGRPVICIGPVDGDAAAIISETGHGKTLSYNDFNGLSEYLEELTSFKTQPKKAPLQYSRKELTRKLASILHH